MKSSAILPLRLRALPAAVFAVLPLLASAQTAPDPSAAPAAPAAAALPEVVVRETPSVAQKNGLPVTTESITAAQIANTINATETEDALKYLPSVLVRKRFNGDTQATIASRTTGINASARTLVMVDGVMLSSLINNNNSNASPRWYMVAPEEIARIDVMYGPFAAAYPGNSYGLVAEITTRMPDKFEASAKYNTGWQDFREYGTSNTYRTQQQSATMGDRVGQLSWFISANRLDGYSQPLTFGTLAQSTTAAGAALPVVTGAYADRNRTNGAIQVAGAGSVTHTVQDNFKIKTAYDFTPTLSATYTLSYWHNRADQGAQTYLSSNGTPYYGAASGNVNIGGYAYSAASIGALYSSNNVEQEQWMQSLALKSNTRGEWDGEALVSTMRSSKDLTRTSTGLYPAAGVGGAGRISDASGTGWTTIDLKGTWRPQGVGGAHIVTAGLHQDRFTLANPIYNTSDWANGGNGALFSDSRGQTRTQAVWAQDVWKFTPAWQATLGGRYEQWRASDGFNNNLNGAAYFPVNQPESTRSGFSPKASLAWQADDNWLLTGSFGKALRFPTVGELYQNVAVGAVYLQANPNLKPESVLSTELAAERQLDHGKVRVSLFEERVSDALISQNSTQNGITTAFTQNIDKTRQRGVEVSATREDVLIRGLQLDGSATYVDARILANSSYVPTAPGATSVGKQTPYVPKWRATLAATYKPDDQWSMTLAGRYSGSFYSTVDNTDVNGHTYQGFEGFFVADARVTYRIDRHWGAAVGVDNLTNRDYFLFHPFPQRTLYAELKYAF